MLLESKYNLKPDTIYYLKYLRWHLGYCHEDYLPTSRGFDTFRGFYTGSQSYYTHIPCPTCTLVGGGPKGYDYRHNTEVDLAANGTYSSVIIWT